MSTQKTENSEGKAAETGNKTSAVNEQFNNRNIELHGRWVQAKKDIEKSNENKDKRAQVKAQRDLDRIGSEVLEVNAGLAGNEARAFSSNNPGASFDYMQAGLMGVWEAFTKWDPSRGITLGTFSRPYIHGAVLRAVRSSEFSQITQTDFNQRHKVVKVKRRLETELGREPTHREIAEEAEVSIRIVERSLAKKPASLSAPVGDGQSTLGDIAQGQEAEPSLNEAEMEFIERLLPNLSEAETWVLVQRFGIGGAPPQSLVKVADSMGIGREIARRTEKKGLAKLAQLQGIQLPEDE